MIVKLFENVNESSLKNITVRNLKNIVVGIEQRKIEKKNKEMIKKE